MRAKLVREGFMDDRPYAISVLKGYSGVTFEDVERLSALPYSFHPKSEDEIKNKVNAEEIADILPKMPIVEFADYYTLPQGKIGLLDHWSHYIPFDFPFIAIVRRTDQTYIVDPDETDYAERIIELVGFDRMKYFAY